LNNHAKIFALYEYFQNNPDDLGSFDDFLLSVKLFHPTTNGGIAFVADKNDQSIWWGQIYSPGFIPGLKTLHRLFLICWLFGCNVIAVRTNDKSRRLMKILKFQELESNLFALRLSDNAET